MRRANFESLRMEFCKVVLAGCMFRKAADSTAKWVAIYIPTVSL